MLSYQHVYHAGNHADILKHAVFVLILKHLKQKAKPFTVFDSHAGEGFYYLDDVRSQKTGEVNNGLKRFLSEIQNEQYQDASSLLEGYTNLISAYEKTNRYPGSPEIARNLLRPTDELILSELHPQAIESLRENMKEDCITKTGITPHIHHRNGYELLSSLTPPHIKRGIALIDPSFEDTQDFYDCSETLTRVHQKWPVGILALWYPIVSRRATEIQTMKEELTHAAQSGSSASRVLDIQLIVTDDSRLEGKSALTGSGMFIINAPYLLDEQMKTILPSLAKILGDENAQWEVNLTDNEA